MVLNKQAKKESNVNYDVTFYSEEGCQTEGVVSKVAFKAFRRDGTNGSYNRRNH